MKKNYNLYVYTYASKKVLDKKNYNILVPTDGFEPSRDFIPLPPQDSVYT